MADYKDLKIGFIGFGNMAQAIAYGLIGQKTVESNQIFASAKHWDKLCKNTKDYGIIPCRTSEEVAKNSDIIFIAVKPQHVIPVVEPIRDILKDKIIVSVVVNLLFNDYEEILLPGTQHISTLPNIPVVVGEGAFLLEEKHSLKEKEKKLLDAMLNTISAVEYLDSEHLSIAGTVTGCGPAFAAVFAEALADGAVMHGLPRAQAYRLAGQMMAGTGKMIQELGIHPGTLKDDVCSPGGSTIIGVTTLERKGLRSAVIDAVHAIETR